MKRFRLKILIEIGVIRNCKWLIINLAFVFISESYKQLSNMNAKQFLALFLSVSILKIVDGTFGTEAVVSGLAVHLPLLIAPAGTLSLPLAALGVLKLAAAAALLGEYAVSQQGQQDEGYAPVEEHYSPSHYFRSFRRYRNKRW